MIIKAILCTLVFIVVLVIIATMFSTIYTTFDPLLDTVNSTIPIDYRFRDTTFNYLRGLVWLIPLSAIAIFIVYSIHSRRR